MINFEALEPRLSALSKEFSSASPFEHVMLENFADAEALDRALDAIKKPADLIAGRNDHIFQKNKYENPRFYELCTEFEHLRQDLLSERFQAILREITGQDVFVDPEFHGGGLHLGGYASKLDMHTDFNYHPEHSHWFRNLNVILFLNKDWQPEYGGELCFRHISTGERKQIEPRFNRCVIMFTRDYTLHGHATINFPDGMFRTSIASYAYDIREPQHVSSTTWYPEGNALKRAIGRNWTTLVKIKSALIGSRTSRLKKQAGAAAEKMPEK